MSPKKQAKKILSPRKRRPAPDQPTPVFPPGKPKPFRRRRPTPTKFKLPPPWLTGRQKVKAGALQIVKEIMYEIELAIALAGKTTSANAFQEFRPALTVGIAQKLGKGGNWTTDGPNVRAAARLMGTLAAALAHPSTVVAKTHIHAAFYAVKNGSTVCTNASGGGSWCDFFI